MRSSGAPTNSTIWVETKRHDNSVSILVIIKQDLTVYQPKHLELFYISYRNVPNKQVSEYRYRGGFSFIVIKQM
jgi:hypothetical protein